VFHGVRHKLRELQIAVTEIQKWKPQVLVYTRSAQHSGLPDNSIDYIFTDPPFGGNIQYSEINFLSEAWLGAFTDNKYETVVSNVQKKKLKDYEELLTDAFRENFRVLKPGRYMTVVFHSVNGELWNCLRRSIVKAGFEIVNSSILAKQQTSFKQTTTAGAVKKDPIIVAIKSPMSATKVPISRRIGPEEFLRNRLATLTGDEMEERTFDFLFSRYVGSCLASGQDVLIDAGKFKELLSKIAEQRDGQWFLRETKNE
jgi:DNA modification methylase